MILSDLGQSWNAMEASRRQSLLLLALLPGLYIADLVYGALYINEIEITPSPGQMTRGLVLLIAVWFLVSDRSNRFSAYSLFLAVMCTMIGVSTLISPDFPGSLSFDIKSAARIMYGPFAVLVFLRIFTVYGTRYRDMLFFVELIFYGIGLLLFTLSQLDIGQRTYGSYAYGFKGLFEPQNDVGLSATIAFAAALYGNICRPRILRLVLLTLAMLGIAGMGTRTAMAAPLLVSLAVAFVFVSVEFSRPPDSRRLLSLLARLAVILTLSGLVSLHSYGLATGQRIIPNPFAGWTDKGGDGEELEPDGSTYYQRLKMERTMKGEAHRKDLLERALKHTTGRPLVYDLLGEGTYSYRMGVARFWPGIKPGEDRYAEMDWFDLYGQYGLFFSIALHIFYGLFLCAALFYWVTRRQVEFGVFALMIGLYLSHSIIAGHAMNSPMASTQIAAVNAFLYMLMRRRTAAAGGADDTETT